jgi:SapC
MTNPRDEAKANLPLFFSNPHVISHGRHAIAKLRNDITLDFALHTNAIPLTAADIVEAAKFYPLAFTQSEQTMLVAIVGLEQQNYYVDSLGQWAEGCFVPSYVRKYPFVFMETPENGKLTLCVDERALIFNAKAEGTPLYENGHPSTFINNALEFCAAHHEQHQISAEFSRELVRKKMLEPQRREFELNGGRKIQLNRFQLIDPEKLKALTKSEAFDWYKNGFLALAYYIMQSQSNWRNILERANMNQGRAAKANQ